MKFISDDGKIFDTMEECEEYEKESKLLQFWNSFVFTWNKNGISTTIDFDSTDNMHDIEDDMFEIATTERGSFIEILCSDNDLCKEVSDWFYNHNVIFPSAKGLWRWEVDEWVSLEEDMKKWKRNWGALGYKITRD